MTENEVKYDMRWCLRHIVILKAIIAVGLIAAYFLPEHYAIMAGCCANMLWLWKL